MESTTDPTEIVRICRKIIRAHESEIWTESEGPGKGARFLFTLLVATPHGS